MDILVITGMSGSGKSSALNILEDNGYYTMDNVPPLLLQNFIQLVSNTKSNISKVAIGIDVRSKEFFLDLLDVVESLKKESHKISIIFFDAKDEVLIKRFKSLRRNHPLDRTGNIFDGIQRERKFLEELKKSVDYIYDTSTSNLAMLKSYIESNICIDENDEMKIIVSSFGFKEGIILDADLVFDARFLENPFYIEELRDLTGEDEPIKKFLNSFKETLEFKDKIFDLMDFLIPKYNKEGKKILSIAFGCTGGKHRSVFMATELYNYLISHGKPVKIIHRDIKKR